VTRLITIGSLVHPNRLCPSKTQTCQKLEIRHHETQTQVSEINTYPISTNLMMDRAVPSSTLVHVEVVIRMLHPHPHPLIVQLSVAAMVVYNSNVRDLPLLIQKLI